jgi:hypothetical protein
MGLVSEIAKVAGVSVHNEGSMELISAVDIPVFLEAVKARHTYIILGLEGFLIENKNLIPEMNAIADFSSSAENPDCDGTIIKAVDFLARVGRSDLYYDIILGKR